MYLSKYVFNEYFINRVEYNINDKVFKFLDV